MLILSNSGSGWDLPLGILLYDPDGSLGYLPIHPPSPFSPFSLNQSHLFNDWSSLFNQYRKVCVFLRLLFMVACPIVVLVVWILMASPSLVSEDYGSFISRIWSLRSCVRFRPLMPSPKFRKSIVSKPRRSNIEFLLPFLSLFVVWDPWPTILSNIGNLSRCVYLSISLRIWPSF